MDNSKTMYKTRDAIARPVVKNYIFNKKTKEEYWEKNQQTIYTNNNLLIYFRKMTEFFGTNKAGYP